MLLGEGKEPKLGSLLRVDHATIGSVSPSLLLPLELFPVKNLRWHRHFREREGESSSRPSKSITRGYITLLAAQKGRPPTLGMSNRKASLALLIINGRELFLFSHLNGRAVPGFSGPL